MLLGFRAWRTVHLLSYACWITGVVHSIGAGSDSRSAVWGVTIVAACIGTVGGALVQRTAHAHPR
jgi:DMSO/TMAO reductase YedYZ heme-binding membrane subunit